MKVNGPSRTNPGYEPRAVQKGAEPRAAGSAERVRISGQASALADARAPETADAEKVSRLRDALDKGTFQVDLDKIADAMIREES